MKFNRRFLTCLIVLVALLNPTMSLIGQSSGLRPQVPNPQGEIDARIDAILSELSVDERVGQLFIVNFVGQNATPSDAISELIQTYKIGGVFLAENNNNIDNGAQDTRAQVANLVNQLQTRTHEATFHEMPDGDFFLPLFVATDHEGDGFPNTRLRNGFTPIPSAMALGATWSPADVEAVGTIIGHELASVGINMLLGPVVDVLEKPRPEGSGDINIRAFGGSPFWVGQMGRAYVRGIHLGSDERVLTIAKHFPGHGASDRLPDDEVATVNKTLSELQQSDLIPFFAVTKSDSSDPLGITDGMMPSHIRYRGFQGDVSQLTRPISLDREGMEAFMALPPLAEWREQGLVVCDSLGVPAVKAYYDPTLETFPARQIAKDALLAGNDVLPLVSFAPTRQSGWFTGQLPTITNTVTFFQEEYQVNDIFRQRVDDAVRHIIRAKLHLYPDLALDDVLVNDRGVNEQDEKAVADVARKALTQLYPRQEDLSRRLPAPPRGDEEILIMGCFDDCMPSTRIRGDTVRAALLDLYGPDGSDLIDPEHVHLLDFMDLYRLLTGRFNAAEDSEREKATNIIERIEAADWILFILINYMPDTQPQTGAARLFLRNPAVTFDETTTRFDLRDKKLVALALHAPYYLDATEIVKLSAYYAAYTKVEPALQVALRALFQEITPAGASPVSIEGIGYDLTTALRPAPNQSLRLNLENSPSEGPNGDVWHPGDDVRVRTEPIVDRNGNPVPDGTRVRFVGNYTDLSISLSPRIVTDTVDGIAWAVFRPADAGRLEILASTDGLEATPFSLLVAPIVSTAEPSPIPSATAQRPTATPTATNPPPTPTTPPPTDTAPPPTATIPPATATATKPIAAPKADQSLPVAPASILLIGLVGLGSLVFLWYRHRSTPEPDSSEPIISDAEATGTASADLSALSPTLSGRTLGSCEVGQKLGEGGMGQVYKGHHPLLDRPVAIKILPPALVQSDEMRARFLQEARIAAALRHPNIVQIYDFGESDGYNFMIMEYVQGESLKNILTQLHAAGEMLPVKQVVEIARQIADALAYAHDQGAIHRDLKPANILLTEHGQAILVDFGLAVLRGGPRYTEPGKVWGSPNYIAPEQLGENPRVDARSDIYSLGVLLYEMATGRPPFKSDSVMEVLWQHANVTARSPRELAPDLPAELEAIILKALAKDADERYRNAQEMADALAALGVPAAGTADTPPSDG